MLLFISGKFASLLPERYRGGMEIGASSALISGVMQLVLCLSVFIYRYALFAHNRLFGNGTVALKAAEVGGETAVMGSGLFVLAEYIIQPLTLALAYLAFEGLVRASAALLTGDRSHAASGNNWLATRKNR